MSMLTEIRAVTAMNLAALPQRLGASLVIVIGMTCVVAVFISTLSMSAGFMKAIGNTGSETRAMVLTQGATYEGQGALERSVAAAVEDAPGVARTPQGKPIASAELVTQFPVTKKGGDFFTFATLRGIGPEGFALRPNMKIVEGRMFKPAVHEMIVGTSAQAMFKGVEIGDKIEMPEGDWTVVGSFTSDDDIHQSELLADADTAMSSFRKNVYSSVTVQLTGDSAYDEFKAALTTNPAISVDVQREPEYYAMLAEDLNVILKIIAYWIGGIMAIGAIFGALNTMYAAVSTRSVEIATLRAIGFGPTGVVISVLAEALLLASVGAVLGGAIAWMAFNGNQQGAGTVVFKLAVTPWMLFGGIGVAALVGFFGGLFPAIRAARLPITVALQVR